MQNEGGITGFFDGVTKTIREAVTSDPVAAAKATEQAADTKIADLKQQLQTAEQEKAAAQREQQQPTGISSDVGRDSVTGGRRRKTRKGSKKSRKVKRRRTGRKSNRS